MITFALAYGLYKGIIDNYLAEIVGMSAFDKVKESQFPVL